MNFGGCPVRSTPMRKTFADIQKTTTTEISSMTPVPTISLYSRRDGVVAWQACRHARGYPLARDIEVQASHMGMGWAPEVLERVTSVLTCRRGGAK